MLGSSLEALKANRLVRRLELDETSRRRKVGARREGNQRLESSPKYRESKIMKNRLAAGQAGAVSHGMTAGRSCAALASMPQRDDNRASHWKLSSSRVAKLQRYWEREQRRRSEHENAPQRNAVQNWGSVAEAKKHNALKQK